MSPSESGDWQSAATCSGVGGVEAAGPIVVIVSLPEQRAYVHRNGVVIGVATASACIAAAGARQ